MKKDDTRKYRKRVNVNGWMRHLHVLCFGNCAPDFVGYCPFFWFTWFCVLFFPIIMIGRGFGLVFQHFETAMDGRPPRRAKRPSDALLIDFWTEVKASSLEHMRNAFAAGDYPGLIQYWQVFKWIDTNPDWEKCMQQIWLRREDIRRRIKEYDEKRERRFALIKKLANYAHYIVKPVLAVIALFLTYFVVLFFIWLFKWICHHLTHSGLFLAGSFVGAILIYLIDKLIQRTRKCPDDPRKISKVSKLLDIVSMTISNALEFVTETIATIYTRECPLIEWGDETRPIEKNQP